MMPETPRDYEAEFLAIMNALAESVAEASDDDVLNEAHEMGEDPRTTAARVRDVLKQGAKDYAQRRLREAEKAHKESVESIRGRQHNLPKTPESRRRFFARIMTRKPELQGLLVTFQNRELRNFTDPDIQSCLEHLGALGVLSEFEIPEEQ
jgi:hypothetical protein